MSNFLKSHFRKMTTGSIYGNQCVLKPLSSYEKHTYEKKIITLFYSISK